MAWWWWVGGFALLIVGVKPARRAVKRQILKVIHRKAQRPRKTTRRPPAKKVVRKAARRQPASPWKPVKPVVQPGVRAPKPLAALRPQRCSMACRQSRKPASTCDCACNGRDHGRYRPGTAAAIRSAKYTPAQRKAQRTAVVNEAGERWARRLKQKEPTKPTPKKTGGLRC